MLNLPQQHHHRHKDGHKRDKLKINEEGLKQKF